MAGIGRERVEVVPGVRHFGALVDLEAHAEEDVLDLALDLRQEVQPPAPERLAGQRHVERALRVQPLERFVLDRVATRFDRCLEPRPDAVQEHPALAVPHSPQRLHQVGLPAEVADTRVVELVRRRGRRDGLLRFILVLLPVHGR